MGVSSASSGIDDVVIVGGGLAGLFCALKLAPRPVTVLSAAPVGETTAVGLADGGLAAALGGGDSIESHVADTSLSGCGLADQRTARLMAAEASARVADLVRYGVAFDREPGGALAVLADRGHASPRLLRIGGRGDTGKAIVAALAAAVHRTPSVRVMEGFVAEQLRSNGHDVTGIVARDRRGGLSDRLLFPTRAVVLATGGVGHLYAGTSNPPEARGEGLAMAARAGALLADLEFMECHAPDSAAHYHLGGVHVDARGRTTLDGLWACGEVAATGAHGAQRLSGNPQLEAIVFAARVAEDLRGLLPSAKTTRWSDTHDADAPALSAVDDEAIKKLRMTMNRYVGVVRDHAGLTHALRIIADLSERAHGPETKNALVTAKLIAAAALSRKESRGNHVRSDFPDADPKRARRAFMRLDQAEAAATAAARPMRLDLAS